ncbi:lycopene beta-cyclase CrtY [Marinicaulis aureus]|uniref:Lycopene beta-cyclase CrtY n=1 Tax=Hyphococcus aureus TaxID=2666033 RepID=A0ABW1KW79_9PROT
MSISGKADIAIAGGGLSGALIAYRLRLTRPDVSVVLVEQGPSLGGNHTWSFHGADVRAQTYQWLSAFIVHCWPRQSVRFPEYERVLETSYCSITSSRLHEVVAPMLGDRLILNAPVETIAADRITLGNGDAIEAKAVIDARGAKQSKHLALGFQKFVGQEIEFSGPHGIEAPVIMDATVPQEDGYRFLYILPFTANTALVEDTRYADGDALDRGALRRGIEDYCGSRGWKIAKILREEEGVLPIALAGDIDAFLGETEKGVAQAGMRAALFHPLTGYSLPDAAALAELIASQQDLSGASLARFTRGHAASIWKQRSFYRLLCRMLFTAAAPAQRYKVLQRFYRLPQPLIERFYAGATHLGDQARILAGKPPVPVGRALGCLSEGQYLKSAMKA